MHGEALRQATASCCRRGHSPSCPCHSSWSLHGAERGDPGSGRPGRGGQRERRGTDPRRTVVSSAWAESESGIEARGEGSLESGGPGVPEGPGGRGPASCTEQSPAVRKARRGLTLYYSRLETVRHFFNEVLTSSLCPEPGKDAAGPDQAVALSFLPRQRWGLRHE